MTEHSYSGATYDQNRFDSTAILPEQAIPCYHNPDNNTCDILHAHFDYPELLPKPPPAKTFQQYIEQLEPWEQQLISNFEEVDTERLLTIMGWNEH